jgi:hypothetical protein
VADYLTDPDDVDVEIDPLDVVGPVSPLTPLPDTDHPTADNQGAHDHALDAGRWCGAWCGRPKPEPAPTTQLPDGWAAAVMASLTRPDRRRTATPRPEPEAPRHRVAVTDLTGAPRAFADLALAAGYAVTAVAARGPLSAERSPCAACGVWAPLTQAGALARHTTPGGPCDGAELVEGCCSSCGRKVRALKRGGLAKHDRPAAACDNVALAEDAATYQQADSVIVRATSPAGHRLAASWLDRGKGWEDDGAGLVLAGDRQRPVARTALEAALKAVAALLATQRLTQGAAVPAADAASGAVKPRRATRRRSAPSEAVSDASEAA